MLVCCEVRERGRRGKLVLWPLYWVNSRLASRGVHGGWGRKNLDSSTRCDCVRAHFNTAPGRVLRWLEWPGHRTQTNTPFKLAGGARWALMLGVCITYAPGERGFGSDRVEGEGSGNNK